jgi:hypothetical protein
MVYPNPFIDKIYIDKIEINSFNKFRIYSIAGQLLMQGNLVNLSNEIITSQLKPGIYNLNISGDTSPKNIILIK